MPNYLIDFYDISSDTEISSYFSQNNISVIKNFNAFNKVYLVSSNESPPVSSIVESVHLDDLTNSISPLDITPVIQTTPSDYKEISTSDTNDWWKNYSVRNVDFSLDRQSIPIFGENTVIYCVDSGIELNHPEFENRNINCLWSLNENFSDTTGHGTALVSLMVGNNCGLTSSKVKVVKLWDNSFTTLQSHILGALDAILQDYMISEERFAIVNMSWSIAKNAYIENKIQVLIDAGLACVAAAGNSGIPIQDVTPASMQGVYTIGSYNQEFIPSDFSNYTVESVTSLTKNNTNYGALDCWAPGEQIYVARSTGGYGFSAGTSCSAAIFSASLVYNQSQALNNKNLLSFKRNANGTVSWDQLVDTYRMGLLELDDVRYQNSINKICTYTNTRRIPLTEVDSKMKLMVRVGEWMIKDIFVYELVDSYEILTPLPDSVKIERQWLYFTPNVEPDDPSKIKIQTIEYKVYSKDGITYNKSIDLITLGSDFNRDTLPADDPLISITELDLCRSASTPACPTRACFPIGLICLSDFPAKVCYCGM